MLTNPSIYSDEPSRNIQLKLRRIIISWVRSRLVESLSDIVMVERICIQCHATKFSLK